jgi:hypothetical protein
MEASLTVNGAGRLGRAPDGREGVGHRGTWSSGPGTPEEAQDERSCYEVPSVHSPLAG